MIPRHPDLFSSNPYSSRNHPNDLDPILMIQITIWSRNFQSPNDPTDPREQIAKFKWSTGLRKFGDSFIWIKKSPSPTVVLYGEGLWIWLNSAMIRYFHLIFEGFALWTKLSWLWLNKITCNVRPFLDEIFFFGNWHYHQKCWKCKPFGEVPRVIYLGPLGCLLKTFYSPYMYGGVTFDA